MYIEKEARPMSCSFLLNGGFRHLSLYIALRYSLSLPYIFGHKDSHFVYYNVNYGVRRVAVG